MNIENELKHIDHLTVEVIDSFWELFRSIPIKGMSGLPPMCENWPSDDSMESTVTRIEGRLNAVNTYMYQTTQQIRGLK